MRATINSSLLLKLKPSDKQYDVRDTKLKGFMIRVNPKGKMSYVCQYQRGKRINIGDVGLLTPAQARDKATEILADAIKGVVPLSKRKASVRTLQSFIEQEYTPWVMTNRKDGLRTVARIKRCFYKLFGDKPLQDITPVIMEQWRTTRLKKGCKADTVNRDIATFKAALSKAVLWDYVEKNPLWNFGLLRVDHSPKVRYLTPKEEERLRTELDVRQDNIRQARNNANKWRAQRGIAVFPDAQLVFVDYIKPMVLLSLNTGIRQGELFNLRWNDIDFSQKILSVSGEYAKSRRTRHIPLNEEAFKVLSYWREIASSDGLVFANKEGNQFNNVRKAWLNLLKGAEIENFRWHDMRHHFASKLVMCGVDLNTVRELLGHSDLKMTLRYAHLAPEHKAHAVAKLMSNNFYL